MPLAAMMAATTPSRAGLLLICKSNFSTVSGLLARITTCHFGVVSMNGDGALQVYRLVGQGEREPTSCYPSYGRGAIGVGSGTCCSEKHTGSSFSQYIESGSS